MRGVMSASANGRVVKLHANNALKPLLDSLHGRTLMLDVKTCVSAAGAVLILFVGTARATIVDFVLVQSQSYLKQDVKLYGPTVGVATSVPQAPGSDTTTYYGHFYVDITPTTIQLMPGASIKAAVTGKPPTGLGHHAKVRM